MSIPDIEINSAGIADYPKGSSLGPRTLQDYELVWIERGTCEWQTDERTIVCEPGTVAVCQPGLNDQFHWDKTQSTRHGFIHFNFVEPITVFLPLFRKAQGSNVLFPLLRQAAWLAEQDNDWLNQLAAEATRQALFWFVWGFYGYGRTTPPEEQPRVLTRALVTMRKHWREGHFRQLPVERLAELSGVSRGHLTRVCKKHLNLTPRELTRLLRMEHALLMLSRSDLEIQAISELCGFLNPFHFSRCCRQTYGMSPTEVRQRARAGESRPPCPAAGIRQIYHQQIAP